jgi:hypothetical protein
MELDIRDGGGLGTGHQEKKLMTNDWLRDLILTPRLLDHYHRASDVQTRLHIFEIEQMDHEF